MVSTLAVNVPAVHSRVRRLSGGQRQAVAICRAAGFSSRLVIMDEPTAALGVQETARVEELILRLRDEGHAVLLISHNFEQVMRLSDQVWVMRAGRCVGGRRTDRDHRRGDRRPDHRRPGRLTTAPTAPMTIFTTKLHDDPCPPHQPLGVHALVWVGDTSPASVEHAITQTKEAGFDLLELSLHDAVNLDVAAARDRAERGRPRVACSRGLAFDADVSSDDAAVVARGEKLLHDSLAVTHELGRHPLHRRPLQRPGQVRPPAHRRPGGATW